MSAQQAISEEIVMKHLFKSLVAAGLLLAGNADAGDRHPDEVNTNDNVVKRCKTHTDSDRERLLKSPFRLEPSLRSFRACARSGSSENLPAPRPRGALSCSLKRA